MYLGSLITEDGRSEKEIKRRIMIARSTFTNTRTLLSCRGINLKTRLRAIKCYIWPTHYSMEQKHGQPQNLCCPGLTRFEMLVSSQSFKNIMDGKDYQRGSIEKDRNRQTNSETIQDEETTIARTSNKT